jgi:ribosomal-protein-alanine N-acetyltransferase
MNIRLSPIPLNPDKSESIYDSQDCQTLLNAWEDYYQEIGYNLPWIGYFVWLENEIVGTVAFTGKPNENTVEISYWTFSKHEGKGISTASAKELIRTALENDSNLKIVAKTAPEKNASTRILEKCGFQYNRIVQDHEIGDAWEWTLKK